MTRILRPRGPTLHVPKDYEAPMAPRKFVEATEKWARKSGRHVRWEWSHDMECWTINLSMPDDAPVMRLWREGKLDQPHPPAEGIPLMEQDPDGGWKALDLEEYGPSGIVAMLEKSDLWSGRGQHKHKTLPDLVRETIENNRRQKEKVREERRNWVIDRARDVRRLALKIPFLGVGIDLTDEDD